MTTTIVLTSSTSVRYVESDAGSTIADRLYQTVATTTTTTPVTETSTTATETATSTAVILKSDVIAVRSLLHGSAGPTLTDAL